MSNATPRRTRATRLSRFTPVALGIAVLAISGLAIGQSSYAAFSSTTENAGNNWKAGQIVLTDDDANAATFNAVGLKPGSTDTKCIKVTSTGDIGGAVKMYGSAHSTTKALSDNLDITVALGNGGAFGNCTGFVKTADVYTGTLSNYAVAHTNYANGAGTWASTGADSRTYQITYKVKDAAPNTIQGGTSAINFNWEIQS